LVKIGADTTKEEVDIINQIKFEINTLLSKSRSVAIYVHTDTQEADKGKTLDGLANVETRISMKTKFPASAFLDAPKGIAPTQKLQGAGDFWGVFHGEGLVRGHTYYTNQNSTDVEKLLKLIKKKWSKSAKK